MIEKYPLTVFLRGKGFHVTPFFICNILKGLDYSALLDFSSCEIQFPSCEKVHLYKCLLVCEGKGGELVQSCWWQVRIALRSAMWD